MSAEHRFEAVLVELTRLELKPGDVLAVKVDRRMGREELHYLQHTLNKALPDGVSFVVMAREIELSVVRTEEQSFG